MRSEGGWGKRWGLRGAALSTSSSLPVCDLFHLHLMQFSLVTPRPLFLHLCPVHSNLQKISAITEIFLFAAAHLNLQLLVELKQESLNCPPLSLGYNDRRWPNVLA